MKTTLYFLAFFFREKNKKKKERDISSHSSTLVCNEVDELPFSYHKLYHSTVCDYSVNECVNYLS